jgi:hypothetical protein
LRRVHKDAVLETSHRSVVAANAFVIPLLLTVLPGCASRPTQTSAATEIDCPAETQSQVRLSASAVPLTFPASLSINAGSAEHPALVARRIMVAVSPTTATRSIQVLSSNLTLTTVGGTLAGWAALGHDLAASNAIEVIPGRLRIQPFLGSTPALQAQTTALDVFITPGSTPIDEPALSVAELWNAERKPISPESLRVVLTPVRHLTVFDVVDGTLTLELTAKPNRSSHEYWSCSFSTRLSLIEHDSVLPDLWSLRTTGRRVAANQWLALDDPATGPFRVIFTDPQAADGFAAWLRATRAGRAGHYRLGLFQLEARDIKLPATARQRIGLPFHEMSPEELQSLEVKRLGE